MCCTMMTTPIRLALTIFIITMLSVLVRAGVRPSRKLLQANYNNNYLKNSRAFNIMPIRCSIQQREWMTQCEIDAAEDWDIAQAPNVSLLQLELNILKFIGGKLP